MNSKESRNVKSGEMCVRNRMIDEKASGLTAPGDDSGGEGPSGSRELEEAKWNSSKLSVQEISEPEEVGCLWRNLHLHRGLIFAFASCIFVSSGSIGVKMLSGRISPTEVATIRLFSYLFLSLPLLVLFRVSPKVTLTQLKWLLLRIVAGASAMTLSFYSYQNIPVGDATALLLCNTIFTGIFAWIIMGERYTLVDATLAVIAIFGVVLIARPSFLFGDLVGARKEGDTLLGVLAALLCAFCAATVFVLTRKLGGIKVHPLTQIMAFGSAGSVLTAIATTALGEWRIPQCGRDRLILIFIGIVGFLAQICMTLAFKLERASYVAMVKSNNVIVAFLLEFAVFGTVPHWLSVIGTLLVLFSSLGVTVKKWIASRNQPQGKENTDEEERECEEQMISNSNDKKEEEAHGH
ncbi:solute carrier family 35 member G1-like [Diadema setosum]|uniref:solute carrier family 35 member G1-like n=1 Tax=Diadema setosum TaxID=31175 RepID=UPI003B3AF542